MQSDASLATTGPRSNPLAAWFDAEAAAVVTILLGLIQIVLAVPLYYADPSLPKFFILPLVLGILIVAGGSFTMATERRPSRSLIQGCACGNVVGLLGALIAFGLYCYCLKTIRFEKEACNPFPADYEEGPYNCPGEYLVAISWSIVLLLLLDACGAALLLLLLSASTIRALKTE